MRCKAELRYPNASSLHRVIIFCYAENSPLDPTHVVGWHLIDPENKPGQNSSRWPYNPLDPQEKISAVWNPILKVWEDARIALPR